MRVIGKGRNTLEPFVEREWSAENADRFAGAVAPPNWEWREYCLAAHDGEALIGAAIFRVRGGVAHLKNVISSRARRSQGIGGALGDEFVRRARELGCHKLTLVTYYESYISFPIYNSPVSNPCFR